ncbi:MAG: RsmG family class I SAM-dependent methyltransferase, partial [Planctomycetota bacterium]
TEKKANFQKIVCDTLGLENTTILNGRAEAVAHLAQFRQVFDVVTARALAAMPVLTELSLGFVKINGLGLKEELTTAQAAVNQMGGEIEQTLSYALQTEDSEPAKLSLVVCKKIKPTPKEYPRAFGIIKKKPLS